MKLAQNKWNVRLIGHKEPFNYYGYKTKKAAKEFADHWNFWHPDYKVEVINMDNYKIVGE